MLNSCNHRGIATIAVTGAVVAAGAGWAVAENRGDTGGELRVAADVPTVAVGEVQGAITDSFALFRDRAASAMPSDAVDQIAGPQRYGRNASLARSIETVTGTGWVIPGNGYLCIAVPDPVEGYGASCLPTKDAARQGLYISLRGSLPDGKAAETILVPDGLAVRDGRDQKVSVDAGIASVLSAAGADELRVSER